MSRLPSPGSDNGVWGDILNDFLLVEHNSNGTLKDVARPADVSAKADDSAVVHKTGNETITGTKNFTGTLQKSGKTVIAADELLINVKDYGAVGNGSTNDTAAIQAAITAASAGSKIFFPTGTYLVSKDGTGNCLRIDRQNLELFGAGQKGSVVKLANSQGDYEAIFTNKSSGGSNVNISGLRFRDLTVDQNSANNPVADPSSGGPLFNGFPRFALRCFNGSDVQIENSCFINGDTVNTIAANGGAATSRWQIRDCLFDNVGNGANHDHSTIYFHGVDLEVSNCRFIGGGNAARTAIETHGARQLITGNVIRDFQTMMNITGVAANSDNIVVSRNIGVGLGIGIHLWAYNYTGLSGPALNHLIISENQLEIDFDKWSAVLLGYRAGILLNTLSTAVCKDVKIVDNQITYKSFANTPTSTDNQSAGISWYRNEPVTNGTEETDIEISRNHIEGSVSAAIYYQPNILTKRLVIRDNQIVNPGMGAPTSTYRVGVFVATLSNGLHDADISNNQVIDTNATHKITTAIDTQFVDALTSGRMLDNQVRCIDGTNLTVHIGDPSVAWYVRYSMSTYVQPTGAWAAGSAIIETSTGVERRQTATPSGSAWSVVAVTLAGAVTNYFTTNRYYTVPAAGRTTATVANGDGCAIAIPYFLGQSKAFDRIGVEITTAAASTNVRLGIYADNGSNSPGSRVIDAGTIDASTLGAKEVTMNTGTLTQGMYWLVAVPQGGSPTFRALNGSAYHVGGGSLATVVGSGGILAGIYTAAGAVPGALPATFPAVANYAAFPPVIALRAA